MNAGRPIGGFFMFIVLLLGLTAFAVYSNSEKSEDKAIKRIIISGNTLGSAESYLNYTGINADDIDSSLSLDEIRQRFRTHPYLSDAEIIIRPKGIVEVKLQEKEMLCLIELKSGSYLLTEERELLPVLRRLVRVDYPHILNSTVEEVKVFDRISNEDVLEACKIIEMAKIIDPQLYSSLSTVNLREGREIVITFSDMDCFVLFGKGDIARKLCSLEKIRTNAELYRMLIEESGYLDVRFQNYVYLGGREERNSRENQL